jgi:stage II sporulation protein D
MFHSIAITVLLCLNLSLVDREAPVRISLFSLFKPEVVSARVASGEGARIEVDGRADTGLAPGETLRVRRAGTQVNIAITDSTGRVAPTLTARYAQIIPTGSTTIELILPRKIKRVVHGEVLLSPGDGDLRGQLKIVLVTDRESAVASVVAAELSGDRSPEAFNALAVVVRTFMLAHRGRHQAEGYDFCDTTHCQVYRGEQDLSTEAASPVIASAVAGTAGEVLSFAGRAVESYYTSSCGGLSATPLMVWGGNSDGYPFRRVACRWCRRQHYFRWQRSADATAIVSALSVFLGERLSSSTAIDIEHEPSSEFFRTVTIRTGSIERVLTADAFRRAIGRKLGWNTVLSPSFTIERRGARLVFRGRGFGSQVGLCLAGSLAQAAAGRSYRDILSFYFPGTDLSGGVPRE